MLEQSPHAHLTACTCSLVYLGPTQQVIPYFDNLFPNRKCSTYSNPAEHLAKLVHVTSASAVDQTEMLAQAFADSDLRVSASAISKVQEDS